MNSTNYEKYDQKQEKKDKRARISREAFPSIATSRNGVSKDVYGILSPNHSSSNYSAVLLSSPRNDNSLDVFNYSTSYDGNVVYDPYGTVSFTTMPSAIYKNTVVSSAIREMFSSFVHWDSLSSWSTIPDLSYSTLVSLYSLSFEVPIPQNIADTYNQITHQRGEQLSCELLLGDDTISNTAEGKRYESLKLRLLTELSRRPETWDDNPWRLSQYIMAAHNFSEQFRFTEHVCSMNHDRPYKRWKVYLTTLFASGGFPPELFKNEEFCARLHPIFNGKSFFKQPADFSFVTLLLNSGISYDVLRFEKDLPNGFCYLRSFARHLRPLMACVFGPNPPSSLFREKWCTRLFNVLFEHGMLICVNIDLHGNIGHVKWPRTPSDLDRAFPLHVLLSTQFRGKEIFVGAIPATIPCNNPPPPIPSSSFDWAKWLVILQLIWRVLEAAANTRIGNACVRKMIDACDTVMSWDPTYKGRRETIQESVDEVSRVLGSFQFNMKPENIIDPPIENDQEDDRENLDISNTDVVVEKNVDSPTISTLDETQTLSSWIYGFGTMNDLRVRVVDLLVFVLLHATKWREFPLTKLIPLIFLLIFTPVFFGVFCYVFVSCSWIVFHDTFSLYRRRRQVIELNNTISDMDGRGFFEDYDTVVGAGSISTFGTTTSIPFKEFEFINENHRMDVEATVEPVFRGAFCTSASRSVFYYAVQTLTAPRYSESRWRCITNHASNLISLMSALQAQNNPVIDVILDRLSVYMGEVFKPQTKSELAENAWIGEMADGLEKLGNYETSLAGQAMSNFGGFLMTLPILISDINDADTFMKMYKSVVSAIKTTGLSISGILRGIVGMHENVMRCRSTGSTTSALWSIIQGDAINVKYCELLSEIREYTQGLKPPTLVNVEDTRLRLARFRVECRKKTSRNGAGALDITRLRAADEMLAALNRLKQGGRPKFQPFAVSIEGPPGCGKSVLAPALMRYLHKWGGIEDIMHVTYCNLDANFDNDTTNASTGIILDDQANIRSEKRKRTFGGALLPLVNTFASEIPKAELADKGIHFYNHSYVIAIDNDGDRGLRDELYCEHAGRRRFLLYLMCKVKPEFDNGSGGVKKGSSLGSHGEHMLYKVYTYVLNKNVSTKSYPCGEEWIEFNDVFEVVKKYHDEHFEHERKRAENEARNASEAVCAHCGVLPYGLCKCASNMFDAQDIVGESLVTDAIFTRSGQVIRNVGLTVVSKMAFRLVTYLRLTSFRSRPARTAIWLLSHSIIDIIVLLGFVTSAYYCRAILSPGAVLLFMQATLIAFAYYKIKSTWRALVWHSNVDLIETSAHLSRNHMIVAGLALSGAMMMFISQKRFWLPFLDNFVGNKKREEIVKVNEENETITTFPADDVVRDTREWTKPERRVVQEFDQCSRTITHADLRDKVWSHTYRAYLFKGEVSEQTQFFFVTSKIALITAHSLMVYSPKDEEQFRLVSEITVKLVDHRKENRHVTVRILPGQIHIVENSDLAVVCLPEAPLGAMENIIRFFPQVMGKGRHTVCRVTRRDGNQPIIVQEEADILPLSYYVCNHTRVMSLKLGIEIPSRRLIPKVDPDGEIVHVPTTLSVPTAAGDCGSAIFTTGKVRCIMGIHCAGNGKISYAVPVTISEILGAQKKFQERIGYVPEFENNKIMDKILGHEIPKGEPNPKHPINFLPNDGRHVTSLGTIKTNVSPRTAIRINPHLVEAKETIGVKQVKIVPTFSWTRAARKVLVDATSLKPIGNLEHLGQAVEMFSKQFLSQLNIELEKNPHLQRPLNVYEAINGIPNTGIHAMKLSTSAGAFTGKLKGDFIEIEEDGSRYPVQELVDSVVAFRKNLSMNRHPGEFSTACLKDELVKPEKKKTSRLFYISTMTEHVVATQYLEAFLLIVKENPLIFETVLGMNRRGAEWRSWANVFLKPQFAKNCFDTDFAAYDANQQSALKSAATNVILKVLGQLNWDDADMRNIECLLSTWVDTIANVCGEVMHLPNLFTSGNKVTFAMNGFQTSLLARVDFIRFCEKVNLIEKSGEWFSLHPAERKYYPLLSSGIVEFSEHRVNSTAGDDYVGAASDFLIFSGWSVDHFVETCEQWGHTLTTAQKDRNFCVKPIFDCEFLKSFLSWNDELSMLVGVVGPKSYLQPFIGFIPPKEFSPNEYFNDQARNVMDECGFSGRKSFETMRARLLKYWARVGYVLPEALCQSYDDWINITKLSESPQVRPKGVPVDYGYKLIQAYDAIIEPSSMNAENDDKEVMQTTDEIADVVTEPHEHLRMDMLPLEPMTAYEKALKRRVILGTFDMTSQGNTEIAIPIFKAMIEQPLFEPHLLYIGLIKFGVRVTFEVTSPGSVAGGFLASITRFPDTHFSNDINGSQSVARMCLHSQREHIMVPIGSNDGNYKIDAPYRHNSNMLPPGSIVWETMGTLTIQTLSRLYSSGTGVPTIQIKVYGEFLDLSTTGATSFGKVTDLPHAEGKTIPPHKEKFSQKVGKVADVALEISKVPGLSSLAVPAELAKHASSFLHYFGYSRPFMEESSSMSPNLCLNFPNGSGEVPGSTLAVTPQQNSSPLGGASGYPDDELSFQSIGNRWSIFDVFDLESGNPVGHKLSYISVTPFINVRVEGNKFQPAACCVPALFMTKWRGSMEYKITSFLASNCSCKLKVVWDPHGPNSLFTGSKQPQDLGDFVEHAIIDITGHSETTFKIGWGSGYPALHTVPVSNTNPYFEHTSQVSFKNKDISHHWSSETDYTADCHNGSLYIFVQSPLTGSSTGSMQTRIVLSARASEDLQFYDYAGCMPGGLLSLPAGPNDPPGSDMKTVTLFPSSIACANGRGAVCVNLENSSPVEFVPSIPTSNAPPKDSAAPTVAPVAASTKGPEVAPSVLSPSTWMPSIFSSTPTKTETVPPAPTASPNSAAPTAKVTSDPTKQPFTAVPSKAPATSDPTKQPSTSTPSGVPATSDPTKQPSTSTPSVSPATGVPTKQPATAVPTIKPTPMPTIACVNNTLVQINTGSEMGAFGNTNPNGIIYKSGSDFSELVIAANVDSGFRSWDFNTIQWSPCDGTNNVTWSFDYKALAGNNTIDGSSFGNDTWRSTSVTKAMGANKIGNHKITFISDIGQPKIRVRNIRSPVPQGLGYYVRPPLTGTGVQWYQNTGTWNSAQEDSASFYGQIIPDWTTLSMPEFETARNLALNMGYDRYPVVVTWQGSFEIDIGVGISKFNTSVSAHPRRQIVFVPINLPINIRTVHDNPAFDGGIISVGTITAGVHAGKTTVDPRSTNGAGLNIVKSNVARRVLLPDMNAENDPMDVIETTNHFNFGSQNGSEEYVDRMLSGEKVLSMRTLLKIPTTYFHYHLDPALLDDSQGVGHVYFQDVMYKPIQASGIDRQNRAQTPFVYLTQCYSAVKGGMVSHYHIRGEGAILVSRVPCVMNSTGLVAPLGSTAIADTRVNPLLHVKFPSITDREYFYAQEFDVVGSAYKRLGLLTHGGRGLSVDEYRSVAEDFNFMGFRGAGQILTPT